MNPARTLASRFRTQRTDRIRAGEEQVVSIYSLELSTTDVVELRIESVASDIEQTMYVHADGELSIDRGKPASEHLLTVNIDELHEIRTADTDRESIKVTFWNGWKLDTTDQAWTGNSGMVVEELKVMKPASSRSRLWCSDGLGVAEFTNLVATVTAGTDTTT